MMRLLGIAPQRLVVSGLLILAWGLGLWLGVRLGHRLARLNQEAAAAQQRLIHLQGLAARRPRISQTYQAYAGVFEEGSGHAWRQAFLEELEGCADAGVQLTLKPQAIRSHGDVSRLGVAMEIEATQEGLLAFLDRIFALSALVELDRLQVSTAASPDYPLKASLLVSKLTHP